ncbi:hypothetical protein [Lysinibacillus boronitolerans]|uniref:Uncharacterized protein n=1 Tax=Lysinibacillus boronitolerans JCM 21713 = 10a = NBRC 103108 TaxID=1294264 RepID=A0ABR4Y542_9BACI|nr:hypothetical protein [Lysinibacillus boronitolerans]KGR89530.1 hypothetical protein CD31_00475 [Lysinibacillus boronitolerans JCM 21713 = 10a = NBRC 103108]
MATYTIEISLINGKKITIIDDFIDTMHIANSLSDETQSEWYFYRNSYGEGAFLRSQIVDFVANRK